MTKQSKRNLKIHADGLSNYTHDVAIRLFVTDTYRARTYWFSLTNIRVDARQMHNTITLAKVLNAPYTSYIGMCRWIWQNDLNNAEINKDRVAEIINTLRITKWK